MGAHPSLILSFHNLQERTPVQSDQSHTRGCLSTVNVGSDDLYDLCVPVLEDSATDEEEKTEKVEELVKIQGCRVVHKTFLQSSQPASPTAKTLRSPRIASSNHKEQMPYSDVESAVSLPGRPSTHFARKFDSSFQRPNRTKLFKHRFFRVLHPD